MIANTLKRLRKRFGISAPRVAVRTHVPWYVRWFALAVLLAFSVALAAWMYDAGRRFAGFDRSEVEDELTTLRQDMAKARGELRRLQAIADATESRLSIERTAQTKLGEQIRTLEQENARLREDLAIFENMLSADARSAQPLAVQRFRVEADALPGEYVYKMVLMAGARRERGEFQGRLELVVSLQDGGRNAMISLPDRNEADSPAYKLSFKHFQRVEGRFRISPTAKIASVQARVFEGGATQAKVTQNATLGP